MRKYRKAIWDWTAVSGQHHSVSIPSRQKHLEPQLSYGFQRNPERHIPVFRLAVKYAMRSFVDSTAVNNFNLYNLYNCKERNASPKACLVLSVHAEFQIFIQTQLPRLKSLDLKVAGSLHLLKHNLCSPAVRGEHLLIPVMLSEKHSDLAKNNRDRSGGKR